MICDSIVVHPFYRGRGYDAPMLSWGVRLAKRNGFGLGAITSSMTEPLFMEHGFKVVDRAPVPNDGVGFRGFLLGVVLLRWEELRGW